MAYDPLIRQQLDYYCARALKYDEWWLRQGRYDRGEKANVAWFQDVRRLEETLRQFQPAGRVLELACGTGLWTQHLVKTADSVTAVDGSAEMLALNADRCHESARKINYCQADLFAWEPDVKFDTVFFAFWLSHIPPERFSDFWRMIGRSLAPGGRVLFFDSLHTPSSIAIDHCLPPPEKITLERRLNDGQTFTIYKIFYQPAELQVKLREAGWNVVVTRIGDHFLTGECQIATLEI